MPVLATIQYPKGKDPKHAQNLLERVADVLMDELKVKPEQVRVIVREMEGTRYSAGGIMGYELDGFSEEPESRTKAREEKNRRQQNA